MDVAQREPLRPMKPVDALLEFTRLPREEIVLDLPFNAFGSGRGAYGRPRGRSDELPEAPARPGRDAASAANVADGAKTEQA